MPSNLRPVILPLVGFAATLSLGVLLFSHYSAKQRATRDRAGADLSLLRSNIANSPLDPAVHLALAMHGTASNLAPQQLEQLALRSAAQLAPFDRNVVRAQAFRFFEAGDQRSALERVRTLSKIDPESHADMRNALLQVAGSEAWIEHIDALTAQRSPLLDSIAESTCASKRETALAMWTATRAASVRRLQARTLDCLIGRVASPVEALDVYSLWIDSLPNKPESIGYVFNGNFEANEVQGAFAWRIGAGGEYRDGYTARIQSERVAGVPNRLLQIDFNARPIRSNILSINLALPPGNYQLSYRIKDDVATDAAPLDLALSCHRSNARLGEPAAKSAGASQTTPSPTSGSWREVSRSFAVDPTCHLQRLSLASNSPNWQTRGFKGRLSIDDVAITVQ